MDEFKNDGWLYFVIATGAWLEIAPFSPSEPAPAVYCLSAQQSGGAGVTQYLQLCERTTAVT
jgi:hypothetical protein